jgi:inorganic triphosphatase YgiF
MTADTVPAEIEVKLEAASAEDLRHLAQLRLIGRFRLHPRRAVHLRSLYLDTRELALARAGIALRVRRVARAWEVTAKWSGRVSGSLHERPELTVALPGEPAAPFTLPDGPLRTQLAAVVLGRRLVPILVSDVHRQLRDLLPAGAGPTAAPLAEVALDTVELRAPDGRPAGVSYYEIEIERRAGQTRDLTALSHSLQQRFGLVPSRATKFARGLGELYGATLPAGGAPAIEVRDSVGAAARKVVTAQLARLRAADPGTRVGHDPEALHEQRVAVRRLRSAVRTFATGIPARQREHLAAELRWLGQELGAVRDLDVQLANLAGHAAHLGADAHQCLEGFQRHLESERTVRRAALVAALDSQRYFRLLAVLERFAASPPPLRPRGDAALPVAAAGRRAVKRALRRVMKCGDAIGEVPDPGELHSLRIRAKRLRYLLESLKPITAAPGRKLIKQLVRLQDVLGRFNDAMVATAAVRAYRDGSAASADEAVRRTLTALADTELRRAGVAQADFARAWRRFTGKSTLRQRRVLLADLKTAARKRPAPAAGAAAPRLRQVGAR